MSLTRMMWLLFLAIEMSNLLGQGVYLLKIIPPSYQRQFTNSDNRMAKGQIEAILTNRIQQYRAENFLEANVDSTVYQDEECHAHIHIGPQYTIGTILHAEEGKTEVSPPIFDQVNPRLDTLLLTSYLRQTLDNYTGQGYPFASVSIEGVVDSSASIGLNILAVPNNFIVNDSIVFDSIEIVSRSFLQNYLNIPYGEPYNHSQG